MSNESVVTLTLVTHQPEAFVLVNTKDGTHWQGAPDGRWVERKPINDLLAGMHEIRALARGVDVMKRDHMAFQLGTIAGTATRMIEENE